MVSLFGPRHLKSIKNVIKSFSPSDSIRFKCNLSGNTMKKVLNVAEKNDAA